MDVVRDRVAVLEVQGLPGAEADDARHEHAPVLIQNHGFRVGLEFLAFQAGLYVDEGVGQPAVLSNQHRFVVDRLSGVRLLAAFVRLHGDRLPRGLGAAEGDGARDGAGRGRIYVEILHWLGRFGGLLFLHSGLVAARRREQGRGDNQHLRTPPLPTAATSREQGRGEEQEPFHCTRAAGACGLPGPKCLSSTRFSVALWLVSTTPSAAASAVTNNSSLVIWP